MSIKIIIESDTPLKALSQCAALGLRCMMDENVSAAANPIIQNENPKQKPASEDEGVDWIRSYAPEDEGVDWTRSYAPETIHCNNGATYDNTLLLQNEKHPTPAAPIAKAPTEPAPPVAPPPVTTVPVPTAVPVAATPAITLEQVAKAGADLISASPAKMPELLALLKQFGVPAVNALKPEQTGAFATALRGLGAKI